MSLSHGTICYTFNKTSLISQVPTVAQNSGGHGHTPSPAVHGGSHHHSPAVQSHGPSVMSGHSHTVAPQASAQGQQQFQRLKVCKSNFTFTVENAKEVWGN